MQLIKPEWLEHTHGNKAMEIYSVSVSPDGKRLATGGFDGKVRIWDTEATRDPNTNGRKQLATMSSHTGSVVVVRFSPNGRYIASGSDDKLALIWELDGTRVPHKEFGTHDQVHEVWTARKRLAEHDADIQDLAWSPDGSLLITVGLDSAIVVWSGVNFEKLARIDTHSSHVKGIAFDPANKYFVTCSDDRSARIFRYQGNSKEFTYSVEAVIEEPFAHSPLVSYFRRCSWGPDGEAIACPNATSGPVPTVCIVNRGSWSHDISLVGHEGPVEACLFSPRGYRLPGEKEAMMVVASAGSDNTVTIWSTSGPRPILIVNAISQKAITDLAWTPDGLGLYASSLDGTVALIHFDKELGNVVPEDEITASLLRYGSAQTDMDIPESTEQLKVAERAVGALAEIEATSAPPAVPTAPTAAPAASAAPTESATAAVAAPTENTPAAVPTEPRKSTPTPSTAAATPLPSVKKQRTTITKDGRKRVTPMLISQDSTTASSATPSTIAMAPQSTGLSRPAGVAPDFERPNNGIPKGGISSIVVGTKRKAEEQDDKDKEKATKKGPPEFIRPAVINPACVVSSARLAVPKVFTHLSTDKNASSVLEARNGTNFGDPSRISVVHNGNIVFVDFIQGYAHLLAGSSDHFWAVTTEDGTLYTWSPQGVRLQLPISLGASTVLLTASKYHLTAVLATGMVHAWNLDTKRAVFPPISLAPVLDSASRYTESGTLRAPAITQCWLASEESVVITLNNGNAYTYDPAMLTWSRISEPFWAYGSQYWDSTGFVSLFDDNTGSCAVASAERRTNEEAMLKNSARGKQFQRMARNRMLQDGYSGFEDSVSIAHLETRINACVLLHSKQELEKYLNLYVGRISRDGLRAKLTELLRTLSRTSTYGGLDSKTLLKNALDIASTHRPSQNLVAEYAAANEDMVDI